MVVDTVAMAVMVDTAVIMVDMACTITVGIITGMAECTTADIGTVMVDITAITGTVDITTDVVGLTMADIMVIATTTLAIADATGVMA
jgi:hypothetical protein